VKHINGGQVWDYLCGDRRPRRALIGSLVGLLGLASVAFLLGMGVGLSEFVGWLWVIPIIAVIAGYIGAGLLPTVGSLWLVSLWLWVFPPLIGYLTGEWTGTGRYTTPRMAAFQYTSARAELLGGFETALEIGLALAIIVGTVGYILGSLTHWGVHAQATRTNA